MRPQAILFAIIAVVTVVYPFIVFTSIEKVGPASLSLVLTLCLMAAWFDSEVLLRFYPVMMNLAFSLFFFMSLRQEVSLIERFSQFFVKNPAPYQRTYMRGLTKVWAGILLINAAIAAYTACCSSLQIWTLYNGVISYVFFGLFSLAELVNRYFYKKRYHARLSSIQKPAE